MGNKKDERKCLERVIELGLKQRGATKQFAKALHTALENGDIQEQERPDFVVSVSDGKKQRKNVIGIEHFRVDHLVEKKRNKAGVVSTGVQAVKNTQNIYEKYHKIVQKSDEVPDFVLEEICVEAGKQVQQLHSATYPNFLKSFSYVLNKHTKHADSYRENLNNHSSKRDNVRLGFLIEIHTEFTHLIYIRKGKRHYAADGTMPMFEDVVKLLEQEIRTAKIDFLILYLSQTYPNKNDRIIYIKSNDIRHELERQNIPIYEYAGPDLFLQPFRSFFKKLQPLKLEIDRENDSFSFIREPLQLADNNLLECMFCACKKIFELSDAGKPYITSANMQKIADKMRDQIIGWRHSVIKGEEWKVYPIMKPKPSVIATPSVNEEHNV